MITPAIATPKAMAKKAFTSGTFKSAAKKEPVQAPVPGKGIATKITNPHQVRVSISSALDTIFSS